MNFAPTANIDLLLYIFQLTAAEVLFALHLTRRPHFVMRALLGGAVYLAAAYFIPILIYAVTPGFLTMSVFVISLLYMYFCFGHSFWDVLFCGVGAVTTQNLADNAGYRIAYGGLLSLTGNEALALVVMLLLYVGIYAACYCLCARRMRGLSDLTVGRIPLLILLTVVVFVTFTVQYWLMALGLGDVVVCRLPFVCVCVMSLCIQYGLFERSRLREEKTVLEQLLRQEDRQYKIKEAYTDIINIKCHDLKNQLAVLRRTGEAQSGENIREIENAILIYDRFAKTGNKALDVVLSEKSLLAENYGIRFTYMADGTLLDFMSPSDIASVFGNALDNAIEHLRGVAPEKRVMGLTVSGRPGLVAAHVENYCDGAPVMENGLPVTTKGDRDFHGYGMKSIKLVVEKYGGNLVVSAGGDRFSLDILLPRTADGE